MIMAKLLKSKIWKTEIKQKIIVLSIILILIIFGFAKEALATYKSSGNLTSTNLLSGQTVGSISSFFASTTQPAGTALWVQFSQNSSDWYSAGGVLNATTSIADGSSTTDLSGLGWSGANFYYKMYFNTTDTSQTPVLDEATVNYSSSYKGFIVTETGLVGIGQTSPGARLSVSGGMAVGSLYDQTSASDGNLIVSGLVGIGTTTPAYALDVWGSLAVGTTTIPALFVNSDTGNVGIGTTTSKTSIFTIAQSSQSDYYGLGIYGAGDKSDAHMDLFINNNGASVIAGIGQTGSAVKVYFQTGLFMGSDLSFGIGGSNEYSIRRESATDKLLFNSDNEASTRMAIDTNGLIGIGTTSPAYGLELMATSTDGFFGISSSTQGDVFVIDASGNVGIGTTSPNHLLTVGKVGDATSTYQLGVYGSARATGAFDSNQSFDIAERFLIHPQCQESQSCPEVGDVVEIKEGQIIERASTPYSSKLVGVVSESPGFILSGGLDETNSRLVALAGRVPVKVSLENGLIKIGDLLTSSSSTMGVAMKSTEPGRVIGVALESYDSSEIGQIMVFVNPHWYGGQLAVDGSLAAESEQSGSTENGSLLDSFTQKVKQALISLGVSIENGIAQVKELVTDKLFAKKARIEKLEMVDKATGEIYCTWVENGEWQKMKGECDAVSTSQPLESGGGGGGEIPAEPPVQPPDEPPVETPTEQTPVQGPISQPSDTAPTEQPTVQPAEQTSAPSQTGG